MTVPPFAGAEADSLVVRRVRPQGHTVEQPHGSREMADPPRSIAMAYLEEVAGPRGARTYAAEFRLDVPPA